MIFIFMVLVLTTPTISCSTTNYTGLKKLDAIVDNGGFSALLDDVDDENDGKKSFDVSGVSILKTEIDYLKGLEKIKQLAVEGEMCVGLRQLRDMKDAITLKAFVHYALKHTVPNATWVGSKLEVCIGRIFSICDEAFAVLVLMNNWKEWEEMLSGKDRKRDEESKTLFTNKHITLADGDGGQSMRGGKRKKKDKLQMKGWSEEGISEYNKIMMYLANVRNEAEYKCVEEQLLNMYKDEDKNSNMGRRRKCGAADELILSKKTKPLDAYSLTFVQL